VETTDTVNMNARVCLAILLVCSLVLMKTTETNAAALDDGKGKGKDTADDKGSDTGGKGEANNKVKDTADDKGSDTGGNGEANNKNGMCLDA